MSCITHQVTVIQHVIDGYVCRLTKPYMWMTVGVLLAQILGGPLAAAFLSMDGVGGLKGWQVSC
jgi:hypothetical protein